MRFSRIMLIIAAVAATVGFASTAVADDAPDSTDRPLPEFFEGVRASGAGASHTAVTSGFDSLYQNPAGVARYPMYAIDGAFSYAPQGMIMTAGITDSLLNPDFALGVGWSYFTGTGDHDHLSGHDGRVVLGIPVAPEQLVVGVGLRYLRIADESLPPDPTDDHSHLLINGLTFGAGVNFRASDMVHLGLQVENLIDHCEDNGLCRGATPTQVTGGLGVGDELNFMLTGEATADLTSGPDPMLDFALGGEYLVGHTTWLRAGFQHRSFLDRNLISIGIGWLSEEMGMGFDVSYRHDLNHSSELGYLSTSFSFYPM